MRFKIDKDNRDFVEIKKGPNDKEYIILANFNGIYKIWEQYDNIKDLVKNETARLKEHKKR